MIDDEKLQELLSRASSLYHRGEYQGAISAWKEVLSMDPTSRKAQEGIRMATLLLADWEPPGAQGGDEPSAETPADGAEPSDPDLSPEELEARLDLGVARVRQLLSERKHAEALEGARGLVPLHPKSEKVQALLEEVQQAYESAPFIEEHFTLARELFEQERFAEAEAQCRKVLALDEGHGGARELLARVSSRLGSNLERAAEQLGGMTVKLNVNDLKDLAGPGQPSTPGRPSADTSPAEDATLENDPGDAAIPPAGLDESEPLDLTQEIPAGDGDAAATQEDVSARAALDAAFDQSGVPTEPDPAGGDAAETADPGLPDLEALGVAADEAFAGVPEPVLEGPESTETIPTQETPAPAAAEPEVVEAKTIRPPTDRLIPSQPAPGAGKPPAERSDPAAGAPAAAASPPAAAEAPPEAAPGSPEDAPPDDPSAWEKDLTRLNLKVGERDMLKGTGATAAPTPEAGVDEDLMALLDTDLSSPEETQAAPAGGGIPLASMGEGEMPEVERGETPPAAVKPDESARSERPPVGDVDAERPQTSRRPRKARPKLPPPPPFKEPSRVPRMFALLGMLLLVGGAAVYYFYFFQPRSAAGAGAPSQPGPPPADPAEDAVATLPGPIPTPIGGGSQAAAGEPRGTGGPPAETPPGTDAAPTEGAIPEPPEGDLTPQQIKTEPEPLSPVEVRRRVAALKAEGERLLQAKQWREARAAFQAALAIDPVNFEVKELSDAAQMKLDEERKLQDAFDSAKKLFNDKEYQGCLWKLYRLPRNKGLGDIDRYILNAWYNWAVVSLKAGDTGGALEQVAEVLQIDPSDQDALKIEEVAEKYRNRSKDRIFYTFAGTLKLRTIDQR